jgi:2-dehydro-3-deoxyphosphooctonate aldolase (KDO 8-P synthase)
MEGRDFTLRHAEAIRDIAARLGLPFIFKSSFDKANRTSGRSARGPGMDEGLSLLDEVRRTLGVAVTTDVHLPEQAAPAAECVDLLQIPAFLCRQTDLLLACAATGRPVNVKKGQFLSPWELASAVEKLRDGGAVGVIQTERGTSFGYQNLVVDLRSLAILRAHGAPVVFDATHSVQLPGAGGDRSSGQREFVPVLARAAVAAGVDALFLEVHESPNQALSDGPNMIPLSALEALLASLKRLDELVKSFIDH